MVTGTFDIDDYRKDDYRKRGAAGRPRADAESLRYRLDVVAVSTRDAVCAAGGWMYDRVAAGWEVTVLLPQGWDTRPLRILGVAAVDLESWFTRSAGQGLAVSAEAFTADATVQARVLKALNHRSTDVALWGDGWPLEVNRGMTTVQHVLSGAARLFKSHALAAAGIGCDAVDSTETLVRDAASCLPVESELIRLG
ncbi:hypothetical protein A5791_08970 [Mycobacterium sp. 852002-51163_SCH5372311]|uniref:hypothetical protein n=1 Tax=Mycobacterium sp. 852002-51163_SCH5372311 TaxID=1834097 RepID=UPI0007FECD82|nr:hypothetical protein [Mycobacterium sp. 852002-51163_SCH5372311]OBF80114.1 hypothetical protein A5791_08970 [Mycobacterium sp. 852002-51163_SCH5372311]